MENKELSLNNGEGKVGNLRYDESKDDRWTKDVEEATRKGTERFLQGILPNIDKDLYEVTQEELDLLTTRPEGAMVDITFYRKFDRDNPRKRRILRRESFQAIVGGRQLYEEFELHVQSLNGVSYDKAITFYAFHDFGVANCYFRSLDFSGEAEEVEIFLEEFNSLMRKSPSYKRHLRRQQNS
jgi:hypothetical protein